MATALMPANVPSAHASLADELEALADRLRRITVRISTSAMRWNGLGAGVLWPVAEQHAVLTVLTNAHVIPPGRRDEVVVEIEGGAIVDGRVTARDRDRDLALISLAASPNECAAWAPASIGDARCLRAGEILVALG